MNLGTWAFTVHGAGATFTVGRMLAAEGKLPAIGVLFRRLPEPLLAGLSIPGSLLLAGYTGVLLGTTSIPVWYASPLLGALFMSSSMSTGAAATSLAGTLFKHNSASDDKALSTLGAVFGASEAALLLGYVATSGPAIKPLLKGLPGKLLAAAASALVVAALLDTLSAVSGKHKGPSRLAAPLLSLAGGALLRWAVVRAGRASALDREGTLEAMKPRKGSPGWGPTS
jgi:formate-dependent nitrite reductase membrane component NrfD